MALQPSPLLRGFEQGADGDDVWNRMMPGEERGPLTLDPQGVALGQQFQAIKAGIEAQQARPIWDQNNPVGTETVQSMGVPGPTTYAGPVGQFIDPATGRMTEQGAARMADNPALGFDTGGLGMIKAFHGSPAKFAPTETSPLGAFDDRFINTGEGAQAYGYGHYVAENEGVARGYRDQLAGKAASFEWNGQPVPPGKPAFDLIDQLTEQDWRLGKIAEQSAKYGPRNAIDSFEPNTRNKSDGPAWQAAMDKFKEGAGGSATGHMYEVNVAADPEKFLHWDKPLSEQHPDVQKAVTDVFASRSGGEQYLKNMLAAGHDTGGELHEALGRNQALTSQALKEAGVPGIRYLDQGSRSAGDGSHNAVIFDPSTMEIIRRYGLAGLMGGGGGGAAALAGGGNQEQ